MKILKNLFKHRCIVTREFPCTKLLLLPMVPIPQEEKIVALQGFADQLIRSRHYAAVEVAERRASVLAQWSKLKSAMGKWRSLLGQSQSLQHFKREADEAAAWMAEKMQVACDDSYKDPTNLPVSTKSYTIIHICVHNCIVLVYF